METKLEAYRLRKRRKEVLQNFKQKFLGMIPFRGNANKEGDTDSVIEILSEKSDSTTDLSELLSETLSDREETTVDDSDPDPLMPENKYLRYLFWLVYFLFWATCYAIAIELKFGIVYLIFSALFGIYFNTRTGPKKKGEVSAYSVFNKNCESIDGTLKAEQFEREIRFGPGGVR